DYCAAAESFGPIAILVVVAALLLSVSFMFDPGGATRRDPVTIVVILVVSVLLGCVMIAVQSGLMALLCASARDSAFADHYRSVAVRFGLIWGITTGITMTIALILVVFGVSGAALVLVAVSVIWGFALDVAVFSSY